MVNSSGLNSDFLCEIFRGASGAESKYYNYNFKLIYIVQLMRKNDVMSLVVQKKAFQTRMFSVMTQLFAVFVALLNI